jgi:hypothetical protein
MRLQHSQAIHCSHFCPPPSIDPLSFRDLATTNRGRLVCCFWDYVVYMIRLPMETSIYLILHTKPHFQPLYDIFSPSFRNPAPNTPSHRHSTHFRSPNPPDTPLFFIRCTFRSLPTISVTFPSLYTPFRPETISDRPPNHRIGSLNFGLEFLARMQSSDHTATLRLRHCEGPTPCWPRIGPWTGTLPRDASGSPHIDTAKPHRLDYSPGLRHLRLPLRST